MLLTSARELVEALADEPQVDRLVRAFRMLPERDREPILGVIENNALWRRIADETRDATGIAAVVNPRASLYVHALQQMNEVVQRDTEVISRGIEAFLQLLPLLFHEEVHALWTGAARELDRSTDATTKNLLQRLAREVQDILAGSSPDAGGECQLRPPSVSSTRSSPCSSSGRNDR